MKILMLAEVSSARVLGGAERVLREQAVGLRRRGHEVRLVVRAPLQDDRPTVQIDGEEPPIREDRYAVQQDSVWRFLRSSVQGSRRAVRRVITDGDAGWKIGQARTVGLIHQSGAGLGPMLWRGCGVDAWVYVCHSLAHEEYVSRNPRPTSVMGRVRRQLHVRARRACERFVLRRCRHIVVLSEFMKRRVMTFHGVPEARIAVIPGGADLARFRPPSDPAAVRQTLKLPLNAVVLFTVRNLVPRMGLDQLIKAVPRMGAEGRDVLVLIAGDGPLRGTFERVIHDLHLADRVRLLGFLPEEDLPRYYQAADLVVMPTQELEGFGLVTVEALASGTPVLGTPVGAIPEVLARIDPRLVASGTDAASLAASITQLLGHFRDHPGEQARLSARGRRIVEERYGWDRHTQALEDVLLAASGATR
ncbi:MAG: glycosyltransferase family 4 protein [Nitrospirales bacterium]